LQPIIIGIDPGTTTAYAILDLQGKLITKKSAKGLNLSKLIRETIAHGIPVIAGSDKRIVPSLILKYAAKVGAKISWPKKDLKVEEKRRLVKVKTKNEHELDAVASAIHAYENHRSLIRRTRKTLNIMRKEELFDKVAEFVIRNEDINIKEAVKKLE
jgi:predicted RNase H-like nuclease (RuvC/YqgF family)